MGPSPRSSLKKMLNLCRQSIFILDNPNDTLIIANTIQVKLEDPVQPFMQASGELCWDDCWIPLPLVVGLGLDTEDIFSDTNLTLALYKLQEMRQ
jgi:hypothetical protein